MFVFFALIFRYRGGDIVIGGGYNASEASLIEQAQHLGKKATGLQVSWNSRFYCSGKYPDGWVICCEDVCGGNYSVYRFSFTLCVFFAFLMLCTAAKSRFAAKAHRGYWFFKVFILMTLMVCTLFIRNESMYGYRETARYLSWIFLLFQIVALIDFGYFWNEKWISYDEESDNDSFWGWKAAIVGSAAALFLGSLGAWIAMFLLFGKDGCAAHQTIISLTIVMTVLLTIISCTKYAPHGTLLTSGVVTAYSTFLCYSALASHPNGHCNPFKSDPSNSWFDLVVGILVGVISIVVTASGSDTSIIGKEHGSEMTAKLEDGTPMDSASTLTASDGEQHVGSEQWWKYHSMMIACSMYMAMLLTDWSGQPPFENGVPASVEGANNFDTSDGSFGVKIASQWMCMLLYAWTLLAPYCLRNYRDFGIEFDFD